MASSTIQLDTLYYLAVHEHTHTVIRQGMYSTASAVIHEMAGAQRFIKPHRRMWLVPLIMLIDTRLEL